MPYPQAFAETIFAPLSEKFLYVHSVETSKVIKKFKAKNIQIRKWTSNNRGFCWVDNDGRFWQWSYEPSEEPEQVFTLHARAPRYWLTPITTPDGEWYAICATEKDRRRGVVHCFPADHGEARIFEGPAAATFAFVENSDRRGGAKELAILLLSMVHDRHGSNVSNILAFVREVECSSLVHPYPLRSLLKCAALTAPPPSSDTAVPPSLSHQP